MKLRQDIQNGMDRRAQVRYRPNHHPIDHVPGGGSEQP
jgi:hypothetical protein